MRIHTAQFGLLAVISSTSNERDCEALLSRADAAMYEIKTARCPQRLQKRKR